MARPSPRVTPVMRMTLPSGMTDGVCRPNEKGFNEFLYRRTPSGRPPGWGYSTVPTDQIPGLRFSQAIIHRTVREIVGDAYPAALEERLIGAGRPNNGRREGRSLFEHEARGGGRP